MPGRVLIFDLIWSDGSSGRDLVNSTRLQFDYNFKILGAMSWLVINIIG